MKTYSNVKTARPVSDHEIRVVFENGVEGVFDCSPYMSNPYWRKLSEPAFFRLVRVEYGTLVWPGDIDIDPEEIWEDAEKTTPQPVVPA